MNERNKKGQFLKGITPWNKDKKGVMPIPWNRGLSKEDDKRILEASQKTKESLRNSKKFRERMDNQYGENNPNWKGGRVEVICFTCGKKNKKHLSRIPKSGRTFCSPICWTKLNAKLQQGFNSYNWKGGFPNCKECSVKLKDRKSTYCIFCARIGERGANWKGGVSPINRRIRDCFMMHRWRRKIRKRDNDICQNCGITNVRFHVDHYLVSFSKLMETLKSWVNEFGLDLYESALQFEPLWDIQNGRTLCITCHKKTYNYGITIK